MAANLSEPRRTWLTHLPPSVQKALDDLNPFERRFVQLYCSETHGNGTLAMQLLRNKVTQGKLKRLTKKTKGKVAARAVKDLTYSAAASSASQMLIRPHVRVAINAWMDAFAMTAAEVTAQIADLANANLGPFVSFQRVGRKKELVPVLRSESEEVFRAHQHWIKGIKCNGKTGRTVELELHDRFAALKEQAKILKLTTDQPIVALNLHFQQLSDEQVLAELNAAFDQIRMEQHGENQPALPAGEQVSVVEPPKKEEK